MVAETGKAVADAMERMAQVGWCLAGLPGRPLLARPTGGSMEFALGEMFGAKQRDFARQRLSNQDAGEQRSGQDLCRVKVRLGTMR